MASSGDINTIANSVRIGRDTWGVITSRRKPSREWFKAQAERHGCTVEAIVRMWERGAI